MKKTDWKNGSLTLESALVLPLFFFTVVTLASFMDAVGLQTRTNLSLLGQAERTALMAGAAGELAGRGEKDFWIDLSYTEPFTCGYGLLPVPKLKIAVRARVYPWIGGTIPLSAGAAEGSGGMVLVTDNQEVYHTHADCTHLDLTIMRTSMGNVKNLRNEYGSRYRPCDGFPKNYDGPVYVTAKGEYYYPSTDYNSLTRHVRMVSKTECPELHICERCAAMDAASAAS